ncbi:hypothetical protein DXG01_002753 [Tephrocybe rancida]|nr:hypothetical protein DXG01_002753 [Tephrocybe rancida]
MAEAVGSSFSKDTLADLATCGQALPVEMITPGREVLFVGGMVRESLSVSASSSRDGMDDEESMEKKRRTGHDTVDSGVQDMNYATTEFVQGQTRRWAVWRIGGWRLSDDVARLPNPNPTLQRLLPPRNALRFDIRVSNESDVHARLEGVLTGVEGAQVTRDAGPSPMGFVVSVARDTWSRNARRKRKREEVAHYVVPERDRLQAPALLCIIVLRQGDAEGGVDEVEMEMEVR